MTTLFPDNSTLRVSRVFAAERSRVFNAWASEDIIKQWFCPGNMTVPKASVDFKVGGKYTVTMLESEPEKKENVCYGMYKEIVPHSKIAFTWNWESDHDNHNETIVTMEFTDVDNGTEIVLTHTGFKAIESRDMHSQGWNACIENLAARYLETSPVG